VITLPKTCDIFRPCLNYTTAFSQEKAKNWLRAERVFGEKSVVSGSKQTAGGGFDDVMKA
jgi:hypothetical protein